MLPQPSIETVRQLHEKFFIENRLVEVTLHVLFKQFPQNNDPAQVLLKVVVLSQLYSARVLNMHAEKLAKHIVASNIDPLLAQGSLEAVEKIRNCPDTHRYYSFATKYCSWHRPNAYPMWDGNVEQALWFYKGKDRFHPFTTKELHSYGSFREIVSAFGAFYKLDSCDFKSIDEFLWIVGGEIVKK